jgi:hypothetical protein
MKTRIEIVDRIAELFGREDELENQDSEDMELVRVRAQLDVLEWVVGFLPYPHENQQRRSGDE